MLENQSSNTETGPESSIPDTYDEVCERLESAEQKIEELSKLEETSDEQKEQLSAYQTAVAKLEEKKKTMEQEWEQSASFRRIANKVLSLSNPKPTKEWEAIQTGDWIKIGKNIEEAREQKNTDQIKENLNIWAEMSRQNLDKKGFGEGQMLGVLQRNVIKDIQTFLEEIDKYETQNTAVPWNNVRDKI